MLAGSPSGYNASSIDRRFYHRISDDLILIEYDL